MMANVLQFGDFQSWLPTAGITIRSGWFQQAKTELQIERSTAQSFLSRLMRCPGKTIMILI
jgi:hypothetical protein